jgi:hypothetical protein
MPRKAGRPPKDAANRRDTRLSVRISTALRNKLETARLEEGEQSLSEEVETRLSSSFELEKSVDELFGGKDTRRILQILAEQIDAIEALVGGRIDIPYDPARPRLGPAKLRWFEDPFVYDQVKLMLDSVFQRFKPSGRRVIPKHLLPYPSAKKEVENMGKHFAIVALAQIEVARDHGNEVDVPVQYRKAARSLGKQLKGSPLRKYLKDQQRHLKQYFVKGRDYDK